MEIREIITCSDPNLAKLHLGCGNNYKEGWTNLDRNASTKADVYFDLETCATQPLPFPAGTFDIIYAAHVFEHIHAILPMLEELYRIAKPDAHLLIVVPFGSHDTAFEDPTHVRFFFPKSFMYFGQTAYGGADYGYKGDWEATALDIVLPHEAQFMEEQETINLFYNSRNFASEMGCILRARKPMRQFEGKRELDIPPARFVFARPPR